MITGEDIVRFWYEEIPQTKHFAKDDEFDRELEQRFGELLEQAQRGELWAWRDSALGRLGEIIVLDQFSRNIYRDEPRAFAADQMTLALAIEALKQGCDLEFGVERRLSFYLPIMHSESLVVHDAFSYLFEDLGSEMTLVFARRHHDFIRRFGRYPHRNVILGRQSTDEEIEFLKQPNSSF